MSLFFRTSAQFQFGKIYKNKIPCFFQKSETIAALLLTFIMGGKIVFLSILAYSILIYFGDINFQHTIPLQIVYLLYLATRFILAFKVRLPLGEVIAIIFFIQNCFCVTLISIIKDTYYLQDKIAVGQLSYLLVKENDYIPFAFLASQSLLLGYNFLYKKTNHWKNFIINQIKEYGKNKLLFLLIFSEIGSIIYLFGNTLNQIAYLVSKLFFCSLLALTFSSYKIKPVYIILGIAVILVNTIKGGMFGEFLFFLIIGMLFYLLKTTQSISPSLFFKALSIAFFGAIFLGILQNVKVEHRKNTWNRVIIHKSFSDIILKEIELFKPFEGISYLPILLRLNQSGLVSAAMTKVPNTEPYAAGETIGTALISSLIPRFLYPEKEEAGGKYKIKRFTNVQLSGSTSMNIGLLGEAYVNFGKTGGILFIFCYGIMIALTENYLLKVGKKNVLFLISSPIILSQMIVTETDFLSVFNGIIKFFMFIYIISFLMNRYTTYSK